MSKMSYKSIEDENGYLTLYWYDKDEVEPQDGVPITLINITPSDLEQILKDANNTLVKLIERDPHKLQTLNELALNAFRQLIARQLNK